MNMLSARTDVIRAVVGADGVLLSADMPLLALQLQAGGKEGGPLLIPQLATLARLAGRLNMLLSRPAVAAGDDVDIDMWVRARPDGDRVHLLIHDWRERPARPASAAMIAERVGNFVRLQAGWNWQVDTQMRFVMIDASAVEGEAGSAGKAELPEVGTALTGFFALLEDEESKDLPILQAMAERRPFLNQRAIRKGEVPALFLLSAMPLFDVEGRLIGYRGKAQPAPAVEEEEAAEVEEAEPAPYSTLFGQRLDRALRKPLGRIIANAETISGQLQGPLRRDYANYAGDIAVAGRHLMELVDDLADLEAIERPGFETASEDIDLADIARRTAGLLAVRASDKNIRIDAPDMDEALPATGEFRRALQILVNLVGNAVRYSPEGAMIWVRAEQDGDMARVVVADQGRGISAEDQERIFEKFERLDHVDSAGSGLGLYISRCLARAMGGDITVDSAPGQGARFTLTLPARLA